MFNRNDIQNQMKIKISIKVTFEVKFYMSYTHVFFNNLVMPSDEMIAG